MAAVLVFGMASFQYEVRRGAGEEMGVTVVFLDPARGHYVREIKQDGLVARRNEFLVQQGSECTKKQVLQVYDQVLSVNRKSGAREMASELRNAPHVEMCVFRPDDPWMWSDPWTAEVAALDPRKLRVPAAGLPPPAARVGEGAAGFDYDPAIMRVRAEEDLPDRRFPEKVDPWTANNADWSPPAAPAASARVAPPAPPAGSSPGPGEPLRVATPAGTGPRVAVTGRRVAGRGMALVEPYWKRSTGLVGKFAGFGVSDVPKQVPPPEDRHHLPDGDPDDSMMALADDGCARSTAEGKADGLEDWYLARSEKAPSFVSGTAAGAPPRPDLTVVPPPPPHGPPVDLAVAPPTPDEKPPSLGRRVGGQKLLRNLAGDE